MAAKAPAIREMLTRLRIPRDGVLLVHSSFARFSREGYDLDEVLETLVDWMSQGTLLMPSMSWRFVKKDRPFFDEKETPSNTGVLAETFRKRFSTRRSLHPTHSVSGRGPLAERILATHHRCVTPCSAESPFGRLVEAGGHVLMFGEGFDCCTLLHHCEEIAAPDVYCKPESETETYTCRDAAGQEVQVRLRRHLFLPRDYWQFQDQLAARGELAVHACDSSMCRGFEAARLAKIALDALKANPRAMLAVPG